MAASSWRITPRVCGILLLALGANARAQSKAPAQRSSGFVVLHFSPATAEAPARGCQQDPTNGGARTLLRNYHQPDGSQLTVNGHVALRFKPSTSARQIDSVIAATGIEVFSASNRSTCRRYVFSLARPGEDASTIANALQQSGLVVYATPDLSAGAAEGVPSDAFFVDPVAVRAVARNAVVTEAASTEYGMGQVLSEYTGPLMRVDGTALSAQVAGATGGTSSGAADFVRSHGITTLRLDVPDRSPTAVVRVTLYTLNGTAVRQLVDEALQVGHYLVGWDGMDDKGRRVQPGVYVAVMTAGSFRETHRLVVR